MGITSKMLRARGEKQARELGIDPGRVPPGQYLTSRFPVLTAGPNPRFDLSTWTFRVWGEVETPYELTWPELQALDQVEVTCDIHCVTRWSKLDTTWRGVPAGALLDRAGVKPSGTHVMAHSDAGYTANLSLSALYEDGVLVTPHLRRPAARARPRRAPAAARAQALLLEVGEVPPRARGHARGPDGLLGAQRLPQRGRSLEGGEALVLTTDDRRQNGDRPSADALQTTGRQVCRLPSAVCRLP